MRRQFSRMAMIAILASSVGLPATVSALDFGGVGVGAQMLVVDGDRGVETGFGLDIRTRFLWILGLELSATQIGSSDEVWDVSPFRASLLLHVVQTEYFQLYLSPGLAGRNIGDAFNPVGDTTWYRLGGGIEFKIFEGLRVGAEVHWTVPGPAVTDRYIAENGEALLAELLSGIGNDLAIPSSVSDLTSRFSTAQLLDLLPLDRLEFTVGLRYYF